MQYNTLKELASSTNRVIVGDRVEFKRKKAFIGKKNGVYIFSFLRDSLTSK